MLHYITWARSSCPKSGNREARGKRASEFGSCLYGGELRGRYSPNLADGEHSISMNQPTNLLFPQLSPAKSSSTALRNIDSICIAAHVRRSFLGEIHRITTVTVPKQSFWSSYWMAETRWVASQSYSTHWSILLKLIVSHCDVQLWRERIVGIDYDWD